MMTLDRFAALVDAYGASPARWPAAERGAAAALMKISAEARQLAHEAGALDRLLDAPETAPATRALQDRLFAAIAGDRLMPRNPTARFAPVRWLPAGAVALSLLLGLAIGTQMPSFAGLDEEALAQDAASSAMTASASDGDTWSGANE